MTTVIDLTGRVCVITGASRGIGRASALMLACHGATTILAGRDRDSLEKSVTEIDIAVGPGRATAIPCDVREVESVHALFRSVFELHKRLDVLVANAGVLSDALLGMVRREQVEDTFAVNTFGVIYCAQYASRLMARNGGGSIINVASIIGTNGNVGQTVYGGSKAAVLGITKSLAKELAPQNIRVNAVAPGFIDTDMTRSLPEEKYREREASIAMKRVGTPEEVASVVLFLASDMSAYVTGQTVGVDGGMLI